MVNGNCKRRFGRKELSYDMLMYLKTTNDIESASQKLLYALPNGIGRTISDKEAAKFLGYSP